MAAASSGLGEGVDPLRAKLADELLDFPVVCEATGEWRLPPHAGL
jgi:hypothetical protein